jgi:peroxiredoxin
MSSNLSFVLFFSVLVFASCNQQTRNNNPVKEPFADPKKYGEAIEAPAAILKDASSFWTYQWKNIQLHKPFTALDTASNIISKEVFMSSLSTGKYLPLKLTTTDSSTYYQLYSLNKTVNRETRELIKRWSLQIYEDYKAEGTAFPDYTFVDLEGNIYNKENTKGKTLVVKTWFIRCEPCVKEMPALNNLKQQYKDQKDVLFVSLCLDAENDIKAFLKKKSFDYAIVPEQDKFIEESLKVNAYPTHFVINRQGKIVNKTTDYKVMAYALKKATSE